MEARRLGRTVGVGTRIAARLLREGAARAAAQSAARAEKSIPPYTARGQRLAEGSRRFARSVWTPLARASRILWLEVTGLFFAIFAVFFASNTWRVRTGWHAGPRHREFMLYALCTAIFLYFTVSSYVRARRHKNR